MTRLSQILTAPAVAVFFAVEVTAFGRPPPTLEGLSAAPWCWRAVRRAPAMAGHGNGGSQPPPVWRARRGLR